MSDNEKMQKKARDQKAAKSMSESMDQMGDALSSFLPMLVAGVIIVTIVMGIIALFRSFFIWLWMWIKMLWMYPAIILSAFVVFIIIRIILKKLKGLGTFISFIITLAISIFAWITVTTHYSNIIIRPSVYCADFIQALPDGKIPILYEKSHNKGNVVAELSVDEKVVVNGLSLNKKSYNITTAHNITGWVELGSFPEDAAKTLGNAIGLDGLDRGKSAIDRQVGLLANRYLEKVKAYKDKYIISQKTLNVSRKVNASTPLLYVTQKAYKKGNELKDEGVKVVFSNIVYAEDCTIIYLTVTDSYDSNRAKSGIWELTGGINTHEWKNQLTVTDLDNGTKWKILPANYFNLTSRNVTLDNTGDTYISSVVFFFPPFKSRHFSLIHEAPALPGQKKAGYGGILGTLASFSGSWTGNKNIRDYFIDYNFSEIRVR